MKSWRKKIIYVNCKHCNRICETKNRFYAICKSCIRKYLNSLEDLAAKALKKADVKPEVKKEYTSIYSKIYKQRESLVGIPRSIEIETFSRECLSCNRDFVGYGRFNRICESCKTINAGCNDMWEC